MFADVYKAESDVLSSLLVAVLGGSVGVMVGFIKDGHLFQWSKFSLSDLVVGSFGADLIFAILHSALISVHFQYCASSVSLISCRVVAILERHTIAASVCGALALVLAARVACYIFAHSITREDSTPSPGRWPSGNHSVPDPASVDSSSRRASILDTFRIGGYVIAIVLYSTSWIELAGVELHILTRTILALSAAWLLAIIVTRISIHPASTLVRHLCTAVWCAYAIAWLALAFHLAPRVMSSAITNETAERLKSQWMIVTSLILLLDGDKVQRVFSKSSR